MRKMRNIVTLFVVATFMLGACGGGGQQANASKTIKYSLQATLMEGKMVYVGVGGDINGQMNPVLKADVGDTVEVTLSSGDGTEHNIAFPDFGIDSEHVVGKGNSIKVSFLVDKGGTFDYYCTLPGHREAGMAGVFMVTGESLAATNNNNTAPVANPTSALVVPANPTSGADIVRDPSEVPAPIGDRAPTTVRIDLVAIEVEGQLADGTTYKYWTFNGQVPGPFFRARVGDTLEVHMKNSTNSSMSHSVDFHAVTGPGGGAVMTQTGPGQETVFTAKALNPGLFVYHCATPMVAEHISNGMYGMILIEPEGGLPPVDHEFYVMQGELYTTGKFGDKGLQSESVDKLLNETPEYYVFNGAVGALTDQKPLRAKVGETIRIFFGVGGPNKTSSFHVIGEIFDRVFDSASLLTPPLTNVQTVLVPVAGAVVVEFTLEVPGRFILVDHSLSRLQRGLAGYLIVDGDPQPDIYNGTPAPSGH